MSSKALHNLATAIDNDREPNRPTTETPELASATQRLADALETTSTNTQEK